MATQFLLALFLGTSLAHATPIPLSIGGTTIEFPMNAGYVRLSTELPRNFAYSQAALPPSNRLVEELVTRRDSDLLRKGVDAAAIRYQVQVGRDRESAAISIGEWNDFQKQLVAQMHQMDPNKLADQDGSASNDRMSTVAGKRVDVKLGKMGTPVIYRQTPRSVSFEMVVPVQVKINGQSKSVTAVACGASVMARNRKFLVYAVKVESSAGDAGDLRHQFDAVVDQTVALNPADDVKR